MIFAIFLLNISAALIFLNHINAAKLKGVSSSKVKNGKVLFPGLSVRLKKAGVHSKADITFYILLPAVMIPMGLLSVIFVDTGGGLLLMVAPAFLSGLFLRLRKRRYDSVFQKNAYRIYKYILNQIAAGVRTVDALKSMHEVIEDRELSKIFTKACEAYSVSYDAVQLAEDISERIDTPESRNFTMSIKDGLFESRDEKLLDRLEQMMFNRYFAYIQRMTDSLKTRCLVTVILLCSIIVCMILIPTIMDVQSALDSIFT